MPSRQRKKPVGGRGEYRRAGFARVLFALVRRKDAAAASVAGDVLRLAGPVGSREQPVVEVDVAEERTCWGWGAVRIDSARGASTVSGLSRGDASALADAVRAARLIAWRRALGAHGKAIASIEARLAALSRPRSYVRHGAFKALVAAVQTEAAGLPRGWPGWAPRGPEYRSLKRIRAFLADPEGFREQANAGYLADELDRTRELLDGVEKQPLTDEQRRAVVVDDDRNLVVAAAGSGKTSVMVAKAGWAESRGDRRWADMLLLAFARNAREELADRVAEYLGPEAAGMGVSTFHALGLSIIGKAEGRRPSLAKVATDDKALGALLEEIVEGLLGDRVHGRAFIRWLAYRSVPYRSEHEFESYPEYWDYVLNHEIRTLRGELVKSLEECLIANFLHLNGIAYEYEREYEHDTATAEKGQYKPDFYLTESGIYIEHLALSADGETPPFIDWEEYTASLAWKRELHERHGTKLVETYSHEQSDGGLTERLREKLEAEGVPFKPIARDEIFALLNEQKRVGPFTQLVATFLHHFKGSRLSMAGVRARAAERADGGRALAFVDVFEPIFETYQARLAEAGEIDFHDMINRATDHVAAGRYRSPYGYLLVDEFQDISPGRAALVKALLDQRDGAQLFAVGDDWQAIYRFAGADIGVMLDFHEFFGPGARTELATTFRCSKGVSDVATRFVLANPEQIRKDVRTTHGVEGPGVLIGFGGDEGRPLADAALERIAADAAATGMGRPKVLLLGRYRGRDREMLRRLADARPGLELSYRTVHSAKGLEADYVVVLGLCAGRYGFPMEMTDDPLLDLVLPRRGAYPNAEERRLLYVALTRAGRRAYLLEEGGARSAFVAELLDMGDGIGVFGEPPAVAAACPSCGKGELVPREGTKGKMFYGCSYYPFCEHKEPACPSCGQGRPVRENGTVRCGACGATVEACGQCDGWLREIDGKYGRFVGCSKFPDCRFRRSLARGPKAGSRARPGRKAKGRRRRVS